MVFVRPNCLAPTPYEAQIQPLSPRPEQNTNNVLRPTGLLKLSLPKKDSYGVRQSRPTKILIAVCLLLAAILLLDALADADLETVLLFCFVLVVPSNLLLTYGVRRLVEVRRPLAGP